MIEQLSSDLYRKSYDRVVREIVDKRESLQKQSRDEARTKEELSKRQPDELLELYVSACVKKIATTPSRVQEEVTTKDVVSALKHVSKGDRRNSGVAKPKNVTPPGGAQGRGKGVNLVKKGKGQGKSKPKDKSKCKGQGTNKNKSPAKKFW